MNLDIAKNKIEELEKALSKLPIHEQITYLSKNPNSYEILYNTLFIMYKGLFVKRI